MPFNFRITRGWWIAGGVTVGAMVFGLLALRYGGPLIEPFLPGGPVPADTAAVATLQNGDSIPRAVSIDTANVNAYGPFVVAGRAYSFQVVRDTGGSKPRDAARSVRAIDGAGRVAYDENLFLRRDSTGSEDWLEFYPAVLEDDTGAPRGFQLTYMWYPTAPGSGVAFQLVAPRADSLVVLTPTIIGYYGEARDLPAGSTSRSHRLLPGNQMIIESGRGWYSASIPLRVNFDCRPRSNDCIRIDLRDSVAGLGRYEVQATARQPVDTAVTIEVFPMPRAPTGERITIPEGQAPEILGGAGRVYFERTPGLFLSADNEWLEIRVGTRRVWITGAEAFRAIGLRQAG